MSRPANRATRSGYRARNWRPAPDSLSAAVLGLRYLHLTRYSWLLGIVLIAPAPVSLVLLPGMLANFFVLDTPQQIYHVSWITLWCAAAVMETLRVTTLNAQYRFDDYRAAVRRFRQAWERATDNPEGQWYERFDGWACFLGGLLAALGIWYVIIDACITRTAADPSATLGRLSGGRSHCGSGDSAGVEGSTGRPADHDDYSGKRQWRSDSGAGMDAAARCTVEHVF